VTSSQCKTLRRMCVRPLSSSLSWNEYTCEFSWFRIHFFLYIYFTTSCFTTIRK